MRFRSHSVNHSMMMSHASDPVFVLESKGRKSVSAILPRRTANYSTRSRKSVLSEPVCALHVLRRVLFSYETLSFPKIILAEEAKNHKLNKWCPSFPIHTYVAKGIWFICRCVILIGGYKVWVTFCTLPIIQSAIYINWLILHSLSLIKTVIILSKR